MKKKIHPDYHEITVVMTDGSKFKTRSAWGKKGDELKLDVDKHTHPAWIKGARKLVDTGGRVARFQKRFSNFGLKDNTAKPEPKAEAKPETKTEAKPEPKPEQKATTQPEAKAEPKPEPKAESPA